MNSRGSDAPPLDGGEFLLQLLRKPSSSANPPHMSPHAYPDDPAVAAVGPSIPKFTHPNASYFSSSGYDLAYRAPPTLAQHNYFQHQSPNLNPNYQFPPGYTSNRARIESDGADMGRLAFHRGSSVDNVGRHQLDPNNIVFGSVNVSGGDIVGSMKQGLGVDRRENGFVNERERSSGFVTSLNVDHSNYRRKEGYNGHYRAPPGFSGKVTTIHENKDEGSAGNLNRSCWSTSQPVLRRAGEASVSNSNVEESVVALNDEIDGLEEHLMGSLGLDDELTEKGGNKKFHRDKDYRSNTRGKWIMGQRMRNEKSQALCRRDITRHNGPFLALFESLIPAEEEKIKQKQLLTLLEKLVTREWPEAHLHLYGSCANSFDFSKSDIDVCLAMELGDREKSDVLLRLADILQSENLQNVQALTRARVPIVKLKDPMTGISCDICINNVLAVVNTKLLRDYAQIDSRLRQLAFIVKHWAKSRGVNETYQGTLSSYAYVLMCIHFLQQRRPAILPCLQEMEATYYATVDNVECAFYDKVEMLRNFGVQNRETIAELVWAFFHYWAYCHDYATDVISIRTGTTISKRAKDWTRRVGNDRHLICIEDPFEVSHDLGRVVDKFSIRVLREEFERAAKIMHHDPNPCARLFEPYILI